MGYRELSGPRSQRQSKAGWGVRAAGSRDPALHHSCCKECGGAGTSSRVTAGLGSKQVYVGTRWYSAVSLMKVVAGSRKIHSGWGIWVVFRYQSKNDLLSNRTVKPTD